MTFFLSLPRLVMLNNGSLLITQVKPRNTGLYKCVAKGPRGLPVTLEAPVSLAGKGVHTQACTVLTHYLKTVV